MLRNLFLLIILIGFTTLSWAEETNDLAQIVEHMRLAEAPIDRTDMKSVERGAKIFAANCLSCHTLVYLKYDKLAQKAGITYDKMPVNVKEWPFGVTPPDLSSEADIRGVNWIYTYLHSFYSDHSRPTGANNLLVPNTAMPAILAPYQGEQVLAPKPNQGGVLFGEVQWYNLLTLNRQGSMTPEEYDAMTADLTNFLAYAASPFYAEQQRIGYWVLGFLVILFLFMYALKREYWRDVKKRKQNDQ